MKTRKRILGVAALMVAVVLLAGCMPQVSGRKKQIVTSTAPTQSVAKPSSQEIVSESLPEPKENDFKPIAVGETIITETREITINHVEFSYDVEPMEKDLVYTHYEAASGEVYIDIAVSAKNLQKQNLSADDVMSIKADYNDGYTYSGFCIVESASLGFSMFGTIDPLGTINMRYLIKCPQEVEENTDAPVFLIITVEGLKYKLTMR